MARRGKIVHFETIGMRDVENQKPVEPDTIFSYLFHVETGYECRRDDAL